MYLIEGFSNTAAFSLHPAQKDIYTDRFLNIDSLHDNIGRYITLKGALKKKILGDVVTAAPEIFDFLKCVLTLSEWICRDILLNRTNRGNFRNWI
jgi:hypothetical protein